MQNKYTNPVFAHSVLLTIDVQRDFTDPGAPAEIPRTSGCSLARRRVLDFYRRNFLPIVDVIRMYLPDGTNKDLCRKESIEGGRQIVLPGS